MIGNITNHDTLLHNDWMYITIQSSKRLLISEWKRMETNVTQTASTKLNKPNKQ